MTDKSHIWDGEEKAFWHSEVDMSFIHPFNLIEQCCSSIYTCSTLTPPPILNRFSVFGPAKFSTSSGRSSRPLIHGREGKRWVSASFLQPRGRVKGREGWVRCFGLGTRQSSVLSWWLFLHVQTRNNQINNLKKMKKKWLYNVFSVNVVIYAFQLKAGWYHRRRQRRVNRCLGMSASEKEMW